jgi:hypothetical protein
VPASRLLRVAEIPAPQPGRPRPPRKPRPARR